MNPDFDEISKQIFDEINNAKNILLHCHPFSDPDSIGSVLAMTDYLISLGKNVTPISGDTLLKPEYKILPNFDLIKILNFTQINLSDYDLFIILDSSSKYQITRLREVIFNDSIKTINIDHHVSNTNFANINFVLPSSSSTSEVLYDLFKQWNVKITKEMAICLYFGIFFDSGGFKYAPSNYQTILKAGELAKINPEYREAIFVFENSATPQDIIYQKITLSNIKKFYNDNLVLTTVTLEELGKHGILENNFFADTANKLRTVSGWNITAILDEVKPNEIKFSMRTRDTNKFDLSLIAQNVGTGGGGHRAAAGTTVFGTMEEAVNEFVKKVGDLYPFLNG